MDTLTLTALRQLPTEVFGTQELLDLLAMHKKPHDAIARLVEGGAIVRLCRGHYALADVLRREPLDMFAVANRVYGPSYVSFESALAYHGLIPERVPATVSATLIRSRQYTTPNGQLIYWRMNLDRYYPGALRYPAAGSRHLLIASPEKALIDKIWLDIRGGSIIDCSAYLWNDLRLDYEGASTLDLDYCQDLAKTFGRQVQRVIAHLTQEER